MEVKIKLTMNPEPQMTLFPRIHRERVPINLESISIPTPVISPLSNNTLIRGPPRILQ